MWACEYSPTPYEHSKWEQYCRLEKYLTENDEILDEMLGKNRDKSFARGYVHNPNSPFFIDETIGLPTAIDVANLIHSCGGKVVLAHPFDYKDINHKEYIQDIYNLGILDGIECLHTRHRIEQIEYIKSFCKKK